MSNPEEPRKPLGFVTAGGTVRIPISPSAVIDSRQKTTTTSNFILTRAQRTFVTKKYNKYKKY